MEQTFYEDRPTELGFFSMEKRWIQGDLIEAFQYLKRPTGEMERDSLSRIVVTEQEITESLNCRGCKGTLKII